MNTKKLYLLSLFLFSIVIVQADDLSVQSPVIKRLDYVEANLNKIEDNERTLFAQNQALSNRINSVNGMDVKTNQVAEKDVMVLVLLATLMMFLVLAGCQDRQSGQSKKKQSASNHNKRNLPEIKPQKQDDEYDFMGSQEAVPARFNLAEAYIQMREFQQAKRVLQGILEQGNSDQRQKASALLTQLPSL